MILFIVVRLVYYIYYGISMHTHNSYNISCILFANWLTTIHPTLPPRSDHSVIQIVHVKRRCWRWFRGYSIPCRCSFSRSSTSIITATTYNTTNIGNTNNNGGEQDRLKKSNSNIKFDDDDAVITVYIQRDIRAGEQLFHQLLLYHY